MAVVHMPLSKVQYFAEFLSLRTVGPLHDEDDFQ